MSPVRTARSRSTPSRSTSARTCGWRPRSRDASASCARTAGILAAADLTAALDLQCSRCLRDVVFPVELRLQEEFLPSLDLSSGRPIATDDEPDVARLTDHHELDLETAVREAIQLAEPIAPLDRPDCPGLCVVCGLPLDEGVHDHPDEDIDPRLEALRGFRPDDG